MPEAEVPLSVNQASVSDDVEAANVLTDEVATESVRVEKAKSKKLGVMGWLALLWMSLVAVMAVAPSLLPVAELTTRFREPLTTKEFGPQFPDHAFGFDGSGYDMTSKVVYGTYRSMLISVGAVGFALVVGGFLGLVAGYFRGRVDTVLNNLFNVMLALPTLVLALTLAAVFANDLDVSSSRRITVVTLAIGIASVPLLARITRANTLAWAQREFVLAAKTMGATHTRILLREVLPNVLPAMFSIALLGVAVAIVAEGSLALLGIGVPASIDTPSWGNLIASARSQALVGRPHLILAPSLMIFLTVLSLNYLGDVVRARFDVRESVL